MSGSEWAGFAGTDRDAALLPENPLWLVDALQGTRADATEVGHEEVRGTPTAHHRLTIDLAIADERLPGGIIAPGPRAYRSPRALPAEVWIDEEGRLRRMSFNDASAKRGTETTWSTTELWDFGVRIDIEYPTTSRWGHGQGRPAA